MCRFAKRCENFYPDPDDTKQCLLICQKNPLALSLALMPDRYVEKDRPRTPDEKKIDLTQDIPQRKTRNEMMEKDYEEIVTATQELENEVIEYEPNFDIDDKFKASEVDIDNLIKKTNEKMNSTIVDEEMMDAIEDSFTEHDQVASHPLDNITFEATERTAVIDEPSKPNNPEKYIKIRGRGRPKMTEEEKEEARIKRDKEKIIVNKKKEDDALKRRETMKKRIAKKKIDDAKKAEK